MTHILTRSLVALALLIPAATVGAQSSPLGSPAELVGRFSENYAEAVRSALPPIDAAELAKVIQGVQAAATKEKPLTIGSASELEKFFSLRERRGRGQIGSADFVDAGDAAYNFDAAAGRIYVAWRRSDVEPVSRETFASRIKDIRNAHHMLSERLGIPREEVMFTDFREILSETDGHPVLQNGIKGPIQSEGGTTTLLRAVGGVLVEGSYLRVSSVDAKSLMLVDVRWPRVRLSDAALKNLRSPRDVMEVITKRVATSAKGLPVNVRMAVVLRPMDRSKPNEFVPSLKIGVQPKSVKTKDGFRTDAGEVFYSDLLRDSPPIVESVTHDTEQSAER
jgi:hypothetical protein